MKVFISWSGKRSRSVGEAVREWLPAVLQAVKPYFSPDDVAKGSVWDTEIASELKQSKFGLLVLTPENQNAPWLLYEAGVIGNQLGATKVCPLLFELEWTDIKGPLTRFNGAKFDEGEVRKIVQAINAELGDAALDAQVFDTVFKMWWPKLQEKVRDALKQQQGEPKNVKRPERDMLAEVLSIVRSLADRPLTRSINPMAARDLMAGFERLRACAKMDDPELEKAIRELERPVDYFARFIRHPSGIGSGKTESDSGALNLAAQRERKSTEEGN